MTAKPIVKLSHKDPGDPPEVKPSGARYGETIEVKVELISPMLGGGVTPNEPDEVGWLRASAVKGQLRFWWRALYAHTFNKTNEMRERERELFGGPITFPKGSSTPEGGPGVLRLSVESSRATQGRHHIQGRRQPSLAPEASATVRFQLTTGKDSAERAEIDATIRAWLTLGGVGGRTRRAAGAIRAVSEGLPWNLPQSEASLETYLKELFALSEAEKRGAASSCFSLANLHSVLFGSKHKTGSHAARELQRSYAKTRDSLGDRQSQGRLGAIRPRHASPVHLCVAAAGSAFFPIVLATFPHDSSADTAKDRRVLDNLLTYLINTNTLRPL